MELFKHTDFDFLGKKWPFIILSLILTAAGLVSLAVKGGPRYGIDFRGGALITVTFANRPPVDKVRAALYPALSRWKCRKSTASRTTSSASTRGKIPRCRQPGRRSWTASRRRSDSRPTANTTSTPAAHRRWPITYGTRCRPPASRPPNSSSTRWSGTSWTTANSIPA